ncbi:DUF2795 domain-containing protein, partial [Saccharothrix sp. MB29]|nr:DUF2795 domain-containing protein [Saccharothrix sp. MB29]
TGCGRARRAPGGTMAATIRDHLEESLGEADFPSTRNDLIDAAVDRGDPTAVQALRAIPDRDYANLAEVLRAVESADGVGR